MVSALRRARALASARWALSCSRSRTSSGWWAWWLARAAANRARMAGVAVEGVPSDAGFLAQVRRGQPPVGMGWLAGEQTGQGLLEPLLGAPSVVMAPRRVGFRR
jgi:hypothetical protein